MIALDHAFSALSDPTRRAILDQLARGEATVGQLAQPFAMSLPAISRHLKVLEEAELISNERKGKHRVITLKPASLESVANWLDFHKRFWSGSFQKLEAQLKARKEK